MNSLNKSASKTFLKAALVVVLFVTFIFSPLGQKRNAYASLEDDLKTLESQISETNKNIETKKGEALNLENALSVLDSQIKETELKIKQTETEMKLTEEKIEKTVEELKIQKEILSEYLRVIYEESNTSTLELVASSNSFSEFVDKAEYLETMQLKIRDTVIKVKKMKEELEKKKKDLSKLKDQLSSQRSDLTNKKATQEKMLAMTKMQQSDLEKSAKGLAIKKGAIYCAIYGGCAGDINGNLKVVNSGIYYSQQSEPWGPREYTPGYTMREFGCLITSYAMVRSMLGVHTDPWVEAQKHQYTGDGEMIGGNTPPGERVLGIGQGNIKWDEVNEILDEGRPVIVQYNWSHFVVLTGHNGDTYFVNDPYFSSGAYDGAKITKALGY